MPVFRRPEHGENPFVWLNRELKKHLKANKHLVKALQKRYEIYEKEHPGVVFNEFVRKL